jgi:hypothetical protein
MPSQVVESERTTHIGGIEHRLCRFQRRSRWGIVIAQVELDAATQGKRVEARLSIGLLSRVSPARCDVLYWLKRERKIYRVEVGRLQLTGKYSELVPVDCPVVLWSSMHVSPRAVCSFAMEELVGTKRGRHPKYEDWVKPKKKESL